VRYWLRKWEIKRTDARHTRRDPANAPRDVERICRQHGRTAFVLEGRGASAASFAGKSE
jgi:hypothetical protein